jgi:hypothetical protein
MARKEKRISDDGDAVGAAVELESSLRADGANIVETIAVINTSRTETECFVFELPHHQPIFGFGNAVDAANFSRLLSQRGMRRATPAEVAQLQPGQLNAFVIADELAKFNQTRKAG